MKAKSSKAKFADALEAVLSDIETMPDLERHAIDVAIVQHLDMASKDFRFGMRSLIEALRKPINAHEAKDYAEARKA